MKDKTAVFIQSQARKIDRTPAATEVVVTRLAGGAAETATEAEMEAAAVKIQSVTRGNCDRRWVQRFKRKTENAAVKIQSVTRGNRDRRLVQKLLDELWHDPLAHLAYPGNAQNRTFAAEDCQEPPQLHAWQTAKHSRQPPQLWDPKEKLGPIAEAALDLQPSCEMLEERKPYWKQLKSLVVEGYFSCERHVAINKAEMQIEHSSECPQRLIAMQATEVATG